MFSKSFVSLAAAVALATSAMAAPTTVAKRTSYSPVSFNGYDGYDSMKNFDDFYGSDNYSGYHNTVVVDQSEEVVCHTQTITVIQQQLAVLREYAKKIVTEQICEVEVQTVVLTQFVSGLHDFSSDLTRDSGRSVGYDHDISSHIGSIHDSSGELTHNDLGFQGSSIGSAQVVPSGSNWNPSSSPSSVGNAYSLAKSAGGLSS